MNPKLAKVDKALAALERRASSCDLCPRRCGVDRSRGETGFCGSGSQAGVSSALLHYGEEPVLSGDGGPPGPGSGTVFFTGCNLKCLFCQNYQISWQRRGRIVDDAALAGLYLDLQDRGAYNINLVSPTHVVLPILRALRIALRRGLSLPLIWNSNGYERIDVVETLAGIVDIYLPDMKYFSSRASARYSDAPDYFENAAAALQEMYVQQPDLELDDHGIALRGMIVRHLVLPGGAQDSTAVLDWMARTLSPAVAVSLMSQYHPCHRAPEDIRRPLSPAEYRAVLDRAKELGFLHLFAQPELFAPDEHLIPDFERKDPFPWKP